VNAATTDSVRFLDSGCRLRSIGGTRVQKLVFRLLNAGQPVSTYEVDSGPFEDSN